MPSQKPLTFKKTILIIILSLLLLTSFRIVWIYYHNEPDHPEAAQGVIDLSGWNFTDDQAITLDGEWEFYPNQFIDPTTDKNSSVNDKEYIDVPSNWANAFAGKDDSYGFGTYRVKVKLPNDTDQLYGVRVKDASSAARMYIDGKLKIESGQVTDSAGNTKGYAIPFSSIFTTVNNEVELLVHVSNYENFAEGGLVKSVQIGTNAAIANEAKGSTTLQAIVSMIFFLHGLYALAVYFIGKKRRREFLYFGLLLILHGFTILIDDDKALYLHISAEHYSKLIAILFISILFLVFLFVKHLFKIKSPHFKWFTSYYVLIILSIIVIPINYFSTLSIFMGLFYAITFIFIFISSFQAIKKGYNDAIFVLLYVVTFISAVIWGIFINLGLSHIPFYPFDFIFSILMIVILLIKQHLRVIQLNEKQTIELQMADKKKDEFLTQTSNQLRNPIHGMVSIAESVLKENKYSLSKKDQDNLSLLINIGTKSGFTLNDLNAISNLKDGSLKLIQRQVDIHTITSVITNMLQFINDEKPIILTNDISPHFPLVWGDKGRLMQILFNLIHNAIKYTEKGSITIEAKLTDKKTATIYVKDTGIGMDASKDDSHIFQPYKQQDHPKENSTNGIGIGLSVSKQLVELHGGKIKYTSDRTGTTFSFTISLANENMLARQQTINNEEVAATNIPMQHMKSSEKSTNQQILIVDSDLINIQILRMMLSQKYNVSTAISGKEALKSIAENQFDLIIADIMMPAMTGYELTRRIRIDYTISELPVLLLGSQNNPEEVQISLKSGANGHIIKPVNPLEIKTRVKAILDVKQSINEALYFETAWLQAQINPHFLFNTLNSIAALAEIDTEKMTELLEAFGTYLQRSFSTTNTEAEIPIANELDLIKSYTYIEKVRFGHRLNVEFDIDDNLDVMIPPLSIQPLVENAIKHGVLAKAEGGTVYIRSKATDQCLVITIEDDGVGMTQEKINDIHNQTYKSSDGIGFRNTNRRLIKLYGKGLKIESVPNEGTRITFKVPYDQ